MKKTAIKIAASTAVAASAFVAVAPAQQADAATNATTLATNAQNAGTVLKWAISYEGSADFATRPFNEFNAAKKAVAAAEAAAAKLGTNEKLSLQAKLVDAKIQIVRATAYIDAITSSEKIKSLTSNLNAAIATGDLGKVETAYHAASFEYKKQAKLLDRVYGQSTRDGIRNAVKPAMEAALDAVKYDVTVKMHIDKASALIKEGKLEEAAAELAKADYNLNLKDAKFTFKTQLQKSFDDAAVSLPLQAISAVGDGANTVTVKFSKAYTLDKNLTTLEAGQFKINGLTVQSAKLSEDKKSVVLTTSTQKANTEYTVTWQGKSVSFKTAAVADTSGIAVNQTDAAYLETTDTRTFTAKLTNTDGTPYVGGVSITLPNTGAKITTVNGTLVSNITTWNGVSDSNGNLVFTVGVPTGSASVTDVEATIKKTDSAETSKKTAKTHFFKLAADGNVTLAVKSFYVSAENDYVYANSLKYKWDANDQFFIRGQVVSQAAFETALSNGDTLAVDYKVKAENASTWNITNDVTLAADVAFTNPAIASTDTNGITYDGYNYDLSGTAQAGHTVKVYRLGTLMGTTVADSSGNWTLRGVNLTQNVANTFKAVQYAPGKDGGEFGAIEGAFDTVTINEGAFASTGIALTDVTGDGLSIGDSLTFSFLNNTYGHVFKDGLTGTITVNDGKGYTAKLHVEEIATAGSDGSNVLKIVNITDASNTNFGFNSGSVTVISTTGLINQDELTYNVTESKSNNGVNIVASAAVQASGVVSNAVSPLFVVNGSAFTVKADTLLKDSTGKVLAVGNNVFATNLVENGAEVSINGNVITLVKTAAAKEAEALVIAKAAATPALAAYLTAGGLAADTVYTDVTTAVASGTSADINAKVAVLKAATVAKAQVTTFKANHATVLALTSATYDNKSIVDAALAAYKTLNTDAQTLLTTEKGKLDTLNTQVVTAGKVVKTGKTTTLTALDAGTVLAPKYADAVAVAATLPATPTVTVTLVNGSTEIVGLTAWADTDTYSTATADSYTFTKTGNTSAGEAVTVTVEVVVAP